MSDDLVKRLDSLHKQATVERSHFYVGGCAKDAIHRIEELEAKVRELEEYKWMRFPDIACRMVGTVQMSDYPERLRNFNRAGQLQYEWFDELADHIEEIEADLNYWMAYSDSVWNKCEENRVKLAKALANRVAVMRLEAKLAKLARAAKPFSAIKIKDGMSQPGEIGRTDVTNLRTALAELKGGDA